ncbi:hypothetical protein MHUMG1_08919 [Metarhizium humberi]|uniref:Metallo-beta-lactamase domain-containing protein n=1 Tax=Metarhizium humberi TaxID=2596975 RepID=A0A9P8M3P9_9HYPO|nr:hypothetical protein MHUMG1_08919 [Metarhizium humberi]
MEHDPTILCIIAVLVVIYLIWRLCGIYWRLQHVPGPFFAKFTNLQRVWWVKTGRAHEYHRQMHANYGSIVRFGPNMVSISDPGVIQAIYPSRAGFPKGALPAVFNTQDEDLHKRLRSPIAPLYSMTNVLKFEPLVDETLRLLLKQLDDRHLGGSSFNLGNWLQYFAFDSMGTLTFSRRYGFLVQGRDVHGILEEIWTFMKTVALMGQIPWFDELWNKNALITLFKKPTGFGVLKIVDKFISQRLVRRQECGDLKEKDMLSQFLSIQASNPDVLPSAARAWTFSNIIAGSDSTANVMRTIMYNLLLHRGTLNRCRDELLEAESRAGLSQPCPTWEEVRDLPYLDACLLEALRLHPPFCLPLERVVPSGGLTVCETYLPAGTVVGISPLSAMETAGSSKDEVTLLPVLNAPPSSSTVDVRVIDPGTTLDLQPSLFWQPPLLGLTKVTVPTYCFLISAGNRHVLFDLGVRQDWENLPPSVVSMVQAQTTIQNPRNVSDVLDSDTSSPGIRSTDIEAVILSHAHFDHVGDPSTFPPSTNLVVGPGIRDSHWPGYPTNPAAINLDSDIQGRPVREISFDKTEKGAVAIGSFDALDYFGDGSLYLLNAPGHSVGHMCALARVTVSPDSFVFMGGDSCHHPGVIRPTKYRPCPSQACHGRLSHCTSQSDSESFFTLSPVLTSNYAAALKTVDKIKELDALDNVFVILAHDNTLRGNVNFYPLTINDWRAKGYGKKTRWLFCKELENALESSE